MPTPAAQFTPALPWAAGTRGTITLREPVTKDDLLNGALTFIDGNGMLYQPEDNDGYVDYNDMEGNQQFSIAIEDEGEVSSLELIAPQDDNIQRIVVGPPVGNVLSIEVLDENFDSISEGETGYLFAFCEYEDRTIRCALTQDGIRILTGVKVTDQAIGPHYKVLQRQTAVSVNSLLKLSSIEAEGSLAELPKLWIEISDDNNDAIFKILHSPYDDSVTGAAGEYFKNSQNTYVQWGDSVTELFIQ